MYHHWQTPVGESEGTTAYHEVCSRLKPYLENASWYDTIVVHFWNSKTSSFNTLYLLSDKIYLQLTYIMLRFISNIFTISMIESMYVICWYTLCHWIIYSCPLPYLRRNIRLITLPCKMAQTHVILTTCYLLFSNGHNSLVDGSVMIDKIHVL